RIWTVDVKLVLSRIYVGTHVSVQRPVAAGAGGRVDAFKNSKVPYVERLAADHPLAEYTGEALSAECGGFVEAGQAGHFIPQVGAVGGNIPAPAVVADDVAVEGQLDPFVDDFAIEVNPDPAAWSRLCQGPFEQGIGGRLSEVFE